MANLDVQVALTQRVDEAGATIDLLRVTAANLNGRTLKLCGCAVLLPRGQRIYTDPPRLEYPFDLETGKQCCDCFDCREVAKAARESGYRGKVSLDAMFLEVGGLALPLASASLFTPEHRSGPFDFDVDRWL